MMSPMKSHIDLQCDTGTAEPWRLCRGRCREATGSRALCRDSTGRAGRVGDGASVVALSKAEEKYPCFSKLRKRLSSQDHCGSQRMQKFRLQ